MSGLTTYCWTCYQALLAASPTCPHCQGPVEPPGEVGFTDRLVWALHHPLADRRLLAACLLGQRGDHAAVEPLCEIITEAPDPYTTAAAVGSLVQLTGFAANRSLLERLTRDGTVPVRQAARKILADDQAATADQVASASDEPPSMA